MAIADQLVELIFSWIEEKECFADELVKLAKELESLREKCNVGECVGSTFKVLGGASMIGAGVATISTCGLAAPLMTVAAAYTGIGTTISVTTQIIEDFLSCRTMKKVQIIEKKSKEIARKISQLFQKLESEKEEVNSFAEADELEYHIMAEILKAIARRSGLSDEIINDSIVNDMLNLKLQEVPLQMISDMRSCGAGGGSSPSAGAGQQSGAVRRSGPGHSGDWMGTSDSKSSSPQSTQEMEFSLEPKMKPICAREILTLTLKLTQIPTLTLYGSRNSKSFQGMKSKWFETVLRSISTPGFQTALLGGAMVVGGYDVLTLALPEMIDNWTKMIKGNHVTEASQSLRDTAKQIKKTTQTMKKQIKYIKIMLQETELELQKTIQKELELQEIARIAMIAMIARNARNARNARIARIAMIAMIVMIVMIAMIAQMFKQEEETKDPSVVNVGLLNVHSIKGNKTKRLRIKEIITDNKLKVFLTTETWLDNDTADEALRESSPPNFQFYYECREDIVKQRGGGVAIQFSQELRGRRFPFDSIKNFEYVATTLKHKNWKEPVLFISVYRPSGSTTTSAEFDEFLLEFHLLLNVARSYNSAIVAGDFNVHVEKTHELRSSKFNETYIHYGFEQHVKEPTHNKHGTLDLVFSRNVVVSRVRVRDDKISDHYTIYFSVRPPG